MQSVFPFHQLFSQVTVKFNFLLDCSSTMYDGKLEIMRHVLQYKGDLLGTSKKELEKKETRNTK